MNYPITTQEECLTKQGPNTFNGVCEICDENDGCYKIPFGSFFSRLNYILFLNKNR